MRGQQNIKNTGFILNILSASPVFRLVLSSESPVHYFLPFTVLVSLSLVETKGHITINYVKGLRGLSKISFSRSSDIRTCIRIYLQHKILLSVITLLRKATISNEEVTKGNADGI